MVATALANPLVFSVDDILTTSVDTFPFSAFNGTGTMSATTLNNIIRIRNTGDADYYFSTNPTTGSVNVNGVSFTTAPSTLDLTFIGVVPAVGATVAIPFNSCATSTTIRMGNSLEATVKLFNQRSLKLANLKNNLLIKVNHRQRYVAMVSPQEIRARNVLRDMITEQDWRRYVTNGFIMVKGSHYWYQVFAQGSMQVYWKGKKIKSICIHTVKECPPTDHVINMKTLIEIDEEAIWRNGNVRSA